MLPSKGSNSQPMNGQTAASTKCAISIWQTETLAASHYTKAIIYYSKFAKNQLFDIAYFSPIPNDTPKRGPHYCVLKSY